MSDGFEGARKSGSRHHTSDPEQGETRDEPDQAEHPSNSQPRGRVQELDTVRTGRKRNGARDDVSPKHLGGFTVDRGRPTVAVAVRNHGPTLGAFWTAERIAALWRW